MSILSMAVGESSSAIGSFYAGQLHFHGCRPGTVEANARTVPFILENLEMSVAIGPPYSVGRL